MFLEYLWSTDETSSTIFVSESGIYSVSLTDFNACNQKLDYYTHQKFE